MSQKSHINGADLDNSDIGSARWLGDTCPHLNEPQNLGLAWAVALNGLTACYGVNHNMTRRLIEECRMIDRHLDDLKALAASFSATAMMPLTSSTACPTWRNCGFCPERSIGYSKCPRTMEDEWMRLSILNQIVVVFGLRWLKCHPTLMLAL